MPLYPYRVNSGEHHKTLLRTLIEASGLPRRKAFAAIREGRLSVDGGVLIDPSAPFGGGQLRLDGRILRPRAPQKTYLLLHKPAGYLSAVSDARGRPTVLDLVPAEMRLPGLHPVGRLDLDTTGLLLLTNDGDFTQRLTHPRHEIAKEYWLRSRPPLTERALETLRTGIEIDGRVRAPVHVRMLPASGEYQVAMTLAEGRKRQVRRMIETVGARVLRLKRVREGPLTLGDLPEGSVRSLTPEEVAALLNNGAAAPMRGLTAGDKPGRPRRRKG